MQLSLNRLVALIHELRRRKVIRTAIVYALGGVAFIEATQAVVDVFNLPDIILRVGSFLTLLGLPVVLLLSWVYDLTAEGLRHTPPAPEQSQIVDTETAGPRPALRGSGPSGRANGLSPRAKMAAGAALVGTIALIVYSFARVGPAAAFDPISWKAGEWVDSIAVMVLDNLTGDPAYDALAIGISDEIIRELTQVRPLKVINRHSAEALSNKGLTTRGLADSIKVRHVVEGSIQLQGTNQIRAVITHTDATTDALLWSEALSASLDDPIAAQEMFAAEVTRKVLAAIPGVAAEERITRIDHGPGQQLHQLGVHWLSRRTPEGMRRAIELLNRSIAADAGYAPAWADLSSAYALTMTYRYDVGLDGNALAGRALAAAERAVELEPSMADAYAARGYIRAIGNAPFDEVVADFRQAARIRPNAPSVPSWSARILAATGRNEEAFAAARLAVDLDPMSAGRHIAVAYLSLHLGRYDEAIASARTATDLEPALTLSRAIEGRAMLLAGRARECAELPLGPHAVLRATCLLETGAVEEATAIVDSVTTRLEAADLQDDFTNVLRFEDLAVFHAWRGDATEALRWVQRAYAESPTGIEVRVLQSALFDRVSQDAAFMRRVERIRAGLWSAVERAAGTEVRNIPESAG